MSQRTTVITTTTVKKTEVRQSSVSAGKSRQGQSSEPVSKKYENFARGMYRIVQAGRAPKPVGSVRKSTVASKPGVGKR